MNDIVDRLRGQEPLRLGDRSAAAYVIDRLRAENARLIATLKLIADHYDASDRQIALVEAALAADGE